MLDIKLQSIQSAFIHDIMHAMNDSLGRAMVLAPNRSCHGTRFAIDVHNVYVISARTFDRRYIKAQNIPSLVGTLYMDYG
jgi:hypothetical protein